MTLKIDHILKMKGHKNNLGIDAYDFFFMDLENNWISKMGGTKRNASILKKYDEEAQKFILFQLAYVREEAAIDLMKETGIEPFVSDEHMKYIENNI